jgi:hypothetical protein
MMALVNSEVLFTPPISRVFISPEVITSLMALEIWSANLGSPKYLSIMTELMRMEVGLAIFFPAMFIPEWGIPCENKANSFPIHEPGVIPTPPVIPLLIDSYTCTNVGDNCSIQIGGNHHIKLRRSLDELHGTVIYDHLLIFNERIIFRYFSCGLQEKSVHKLHDIGLVND